MQNVKIEPVNPGYRDPGNEILVLPGKIVKKMCNPRDTLWKQQVYIQESCS